MMFRLQRVANLPNGMWGILTLPDHTVVATLEPFGDDKKPEPIQAGTYIVQLRQSPKFGLTPWICDVPGRQWILIHPGNTVEQTLGCVLPGEDIDVIGKITRSKAAFSRIMDQWSTNKDAHYSIEIIDPE